MIRFDFWFSLIVELSAKQFKGNWNVSAVAKSTSSDIYEMMGLLHCNNVTGSVISCNFLVLMLRHNETNGKWISLERPESDKPSLFTVNGKNITKKEGKSTGTYNSKDKLYGKKF